MNPVGAAARAARGVRSKWADIVAANPGHSAWYVQRFRDMAAGGADLVGEARLVDALAPRAATILDAGCGPGRHAGHLHEAGHTVVGIDLDPVLIGAAEQDFPGPAYLVGDLADVELPADLPQEYDVVYCAGNVMGFLHPDTRRPVLANLARWTRPGGRVVVGFGAGRGYDFEEFFADAEASGLAREQAFSTWDLRPFGPDADFLVAVLTPATQGGGGSGRPGEGGRRPGRAGGRGAAARRGLGGRAHEGGEHDAHDDHAEHDDAHDDEGRDHAAPTGARPAPRRARLEAAVAVGRTGREALLGRRRPAGSTERASVPAGLPEPRRLPEAG